MTWRTIEEVNAAGLQIIKGEKCKLRDPNNVCLWHDSQLKEFISYPRRRYAYVGDSAYDKYDWDDEDYDIDNFGDWGSD